MRKLTREDILTNEEYLKARDERRREIIALKKKRRVDVGKRISLTFENRDTMKYQIQEMMRVEHITDPDKIQFEIDVYNELIPPPGSLSATLFIEISDQSQIRAVLDSFQGLDAPNTLYITVGSEKIFAEFEQGHSKEDRISAVHYIRFQFSDQQIRRFAESQVEVRVEHTAYQATTALTQDQKQEIMRDFQ